MGYAIFVGSCGVLILGALLAWEINLRRTIAFCRLFNARDPETIAAWLPPGHRYDPETRRVYTDDPGRPPYALPEMVIDV